MAENNNLNTYGTIRETANGEPVTWGDFSSRLLEQPDFTYSDNGRGLLEGTASFKWSHDGSMESAIPPVARRDQHPNDSRLWCWDTSTTFGKNKIATTQAKYIGLKQPITDPEWNLSGSVGEQSIRFHPKFAEWVAEAAGDRLKIRLDEQGYFVSFGPNHPAVPAVEQFVSPAGSCSLNFFCNDMGYWQNYSFDNLGTQYDAIPFGPSYLNVSQFNLSWLLVACNVTEYARIFKVEMEFTLSVLAKPHNKEMYPSGS